jgi:hypothetical protein
MRINGQVIKTPTELKVGVFRISKSNRLANGDMSMDIIAVKRRLDCNWTIISASELQQIMNILDSSTFYAVEYVDPKNDEAGTIIAYVGDINQAVWFKRDGVRYWKDVSLSLIEK